MRNQVPVNNRRGSPRVRLISSFAMLAVAAGGVSYYSVRKTSELFGVGVKAHVYCAIAGASPGQTQNAETQAGLGSQFAPMLQPVLDAAGAEYALVSAHRCNVSGRSYLDIILRRNQTMVSVILTPRGDQEMFPKVLSARVVEAAGIPIHEGSRDGYSVAAFESGAWLGYIISALPGPQNNELAARAAPVIDRYTKP
jgi:hypothetical protein